MIRGIPKVGDIMVFTKCGFLRWKITWVDTYTCGSQLVGYCEEPRTHGHGAFMSDELGKIILEETNHWEEDLWHIVRPTISRITKICRNN